MNDFINFARQFAPIENTAAEDLLEKLQTQDFKKGTFILRDREVCRQLYFIDKGLVKLFFTTEYKEFIMRFFAENSMFTLLDSYITQLPALYQIIALEETTITSIRYDDMEFLCKKYHSIETFIRKLFSMAALNMMKRISEMLEESATERYQNFVINNNDLLQRISLGDLSSHLGITQVSLSRIRAKK